MAVNGLILCQYTPYVILIIKVFLKRYDCDKLRPVGKPRGGQGREGRVK